MQCFLVKLCDLMVSRDDSYRQEAYILLGQIISGEGIKVVLKYSKNSND